MFLLWARAAAGLLLTQQCSRVGVWIALKGVAACVRVLGQVSFRDGNDGRQAVLPHTRVKFARTMLGKKWGDE